MSQRQALPTGRSEAPETQLRFADREERVQTANSKREIGSKQIHQVPSGRGRWNSDARPSGELRPYGEERGSASRSGGAGPRLSGAGGGVLTSRSARVARRPAWGPSSVHALNAADTATRPTTRLPLRLHPAGPRGRLGHHLLPHGGRQRGQPPLLPGLRRGRRAGLGPGEAAHPPLRVRGREPAGAGAGPGSGRDRGSGCSRACLWWQLCPPSAGGLGTISLGGSQPPSHGPGFRPGEQCPPARCSHRDDRRRRVSASTARPGPHTRGVPAPGGSPVSAHASGEPSAGVTPTPTDHGSGLGPPDRPGVRHGPEPPRPRADNPLEGLTGRGGTDGSPAPLATKDVTQRQPVGGSTGWVWGHTPGLRALPRRTHPLPAPPRGHPPGSSHCAGVRVPPSAMGEHPRPQPFSLLEAGPRPRPPHLVPQGHSSPRKV